MTAVTISVFCVSAVLAQLDKNADAPAADQRLQLQFLKEQATELTLHRGDPAHSALAMTPEPVLRYSNPLSGGQAGSGVTFLWESSYSLPLEARKTGTYLEPIRKV
jgi:hypothetical protein